MLRYFPACQWPGRHHQRLPVQVAQGQEVEEVLVRDEGQGSLHIQGFRGKKRGIYSTTSYIYNKIELLHAYYSRQFFKNDCMFLIIVFMQLQFLLRFKKSPGWDML